MEGSSLASYINISPTSYGYRGKPSKITIHHAAGNATVEGLGKLFADPNRRASATYGIGTDGRIGQYLDEYMAPCTSSSLDNDWIAVTIEVANDGGEDADWHISDKALSALISLCADICKRNGISRLNYTGDASGNLTRHNMFAATGCPGPYLQSKFDYIANTVNEKLQEDEPMTATEKKEFEALKAQVITLAQEKDELEKRLDTYDKRGVYDNAAIKWAYVDGNLPKWATPTVKKLVNKGYLKGNDKNSLELSYLMLRIFVILDRAGMFD